MAAQGAAQSLIRDPDIEHGLRELAFPILRAAGLNTNRVRVLVVNDGAFNAFVIDYNTIYVNYGLILGVDTPEMLQAVIAHEAAHIANGHLARRTENLRAAQRAATFGTAMALIAAAAGGGEAAAGIAARNIRIRVAQLSGPHAGRGSLGRSQRRQLPALGRYFAGGIGGAAIENLPGKSC